ncbi:lamin tail domain-containing protein, partial [Flavobacteriales bacterium]|nr:lamin tail domain-containing protein [Flavobacteriales bacterium]
MKKLLLFLFCIPFLGITQNSHTINTAGNTFSPSSLTINVGDTVTWNNTGGYHNVNGTQATFPNNPEGFGNSVGAGWTFQWIFTLAGTYDYQCDPHVGMGMTGVVIVNTLPTFATDIFISEYAEGSGTNKYIEIFNGTGQDVDLSNYQLWKVTNGGSWPEYTFNLSSILSNDHVYIVYSSSSNVDPIIAAAGDVTWSQVTWTGDDAVGLAKSDNCPSGPCFTLIDAIGEDGPDPGNGWDVAGVTDATKDHTLVRKCSVTQGNTNWSLSSGTDALNSEWEVLPQNYWSDIDQHTFPCQSTAIYGCTDSTAINFDPLATIDDGSCISVIYGCTDSTAFNYNATANSDDGSCCFQSGCTDPSAYNYDPSACYNDGSCITPNFGCTDPLAMNFDSIADTDDGSCIYLADKVDLFFSEYGEGSSNNKYLEIYNATSNPVDLSSYALTRVSNAPTTIGVYEYWVDFDSAAVILSNDVYIVAHSSSDSVILAQSDMTYSSLSNGDDGFALVYGGKPSSPVLPGNEYVILDFLGDFNGDPGSGWDVAGVTQATKDHVLIRKCDVNMGNTNWVNSAGTDSLNSEWIVLANEDWSDLGQHTHPCQSSPVYGCTNPIACNYDSTATIDDGSCLIVYGCTDAAACNYDPLAECDDGSCLTVWGCTGPTSCNYDPLATCDDGSCYGAIGCMDSLATNYDPYACLDDGSCAYQMTYVPDDNFEGALIALGYDSWPLDDSVRTAYINTITILDVSNTPSPIHEMTGIEDFTALVRLYCNNNHIDEFNTTSSMDLSGLTNLTHLRCQWNFLYSLDVSQNTALVDLDCGGNDLTSLDVSANTALIELAVYGNDLTSLDVSNNLALTGLWCPFNYLTSVDVSNHTSLTTLVCNNNDYLTSVDMRNGNNANLVYFNANWNSVLSCIDVDDPFWMYTYFSNSINGSTSFSGSCSGLGCTDPIACNYNSYATTDDGSCQLPDGCTDPTACNYDALATCDDGSCGYISGCTDPTACNYDPLATCDDGSCSGLFGCTDVTACNYDALATCDDGSCGYISGCTDPTACNYDALATCDDGSCSGLFGCTDPTAVNYDANATCDDGSCINCDLSYSIISASPSTSSSCDGWLATSMVQTSYLPVTYLWNTGSTQSYILNLCAGVYTVTVTDALGCSIDTTINLGEFVLGCTDMTACNYDSLATIDDGSCILPDGCTDILACNYDAAATCDDGSCTYTGCTDPTACNYDPSAGCDDGSCTYPTGCTDPTACNYDPSAGCDDGSCE